MSASIIQKQAAFATVVGSGSVAVTLPNPIGAGSVMVMCAALVQADGSGASSPSITVQDGNSNTYSLSEYSSAGASLFANTYQQQVVPGLGTQIYTLSFTAPSGQSGYTFLAGLCIYELSGVSSLSTNESASQSLTGLHKMADLSASISGLSGGTYGNFLASIFAGTFGAGDTSDANSAAAGSGWMLDGRDAVNGTFGLLAIVFESQFVGPASNPSATFSGSSNTTELDGSILVGAYSLTSAIPGGGSGGGGAASTVFLGSVTEVGSAPSGTSDIFVGTVTVVASAPSGRPNPYLGRVRIGSPSGSQNNLSMGEVVVLTEAPSGETNPYLGTVEQSS
jgi:hypothetical protein